MSEKRFELLDETIFDNQKQAEDGGRVTYWVVEYQQRQELVELLNRLSEENEQLKSQLYSDDEEGVCNICKHHYLVKDDEIELGYYNSRCRKGHYECARVSLKYCEDFEKELGE